MRRGRRRGIEKEQKEGPWKEEDWSGKGFSSFPNPPDLNLASITKLDLSRNSLESIPESAIARLLNLVDLDLHSNQLRSLPNSIGCLSKLRRLDVSGNLLPSLPKTIEACKGLEALLANFNEITCLPDTIGQSFPKLRLLSVHSNKLIYLPQTTHRLTSLQSLDAHLNCLIALPNDLHLLPLLAFVDVSHNFHRLRSLPDSIGLLPSLAHLNISYNSISSLPDSLACAAALCTLRAEGNPLVSPPLDVLANGVDAARGYLFGRINGESKKRGRAAWFGGLARCGTFGFRSRMGQRKIRTEEGEEDEGFMTVDRQYRSIDGLATPSRLETGGRSLHRFFSLQPSTPPRGAWK